MKIAFVNIGDTRDIKRGSGTPYNLWQELLRQGHTVHLVGPLQVNTPFLTRFFKWLSARIGKRYHSYRDPFIGRAFGQEAARALAGLDVDVVLTNDYCLAGYTPTHKPVILYTDSSFPRCYAENIHPWDADLSWFGIFFCRHTTGLGLKRAARCFFASEDAAQAAEKYPQTAGKCLEVIPYGANLADPGRRAPIALNSRVDLLFIGKDWERKGGSLAVEVARQLNQHGLNVHLHVAGLDLSAQYPDAFITFYGLLDKDNQAGAEQLHRLFSTCHVLLLPSRAEGYGLVFVEAAAYGLPSLAYATSGVKTAVRHGVSGILFDPAQGSEVFVHQVRYWLENPEEYQDMCRGARQHYELTANWQVAVSRLGNGLKDLI